MSVQLPVMNDRFKGKLGAMRKFSEGILKLPVPFIHARTNIDNEKAEIGVKAPHIQQRIDMLCHSYIRSMNPNNCDHRSISQELMRKAEGNY